MARGVGGGGGAIIRGRRLLYIFSSKVGRYSRDASNRGTGLLGEIRYPPPVVHLKYRKGNCKTP